MSDIALQVNQTRNAGTIGASDAAAALGLSKYTSPLTVWRKLRGEHDEDDTPAAVREAAQFGTLLEPVVRGKYALDRNKLVLVPTQSTVMDGWLHATPDGFVVNSTTPESVGTEEHDGGTVPPVAEGLMQVKCRSAYLRDEWLHGVPAAEEVQCRVEMAVADLPWNDCVVLLGGNQMLVHRIERERELEKRIVDDLAKFRDLVLAGKEPPVDSSDAWRQYASSRMRPSKVTMTADDELREIVDYWLDQRRKRMRAEEEEEAAKTDLLLRLSAAGATGIDLGGDRRVTAYPVGSKPRWKEYAISLGGESTAPEKFRGTGKPSWTLRAPTDDGDE